LDPSEIRVRVERTNVRDVQTRDFAASDFASGSRLALGQIVLPLTEVSQRHFRFVVAFSVFSIRSLESSFLLPRSAAIKSIVYVRAPTRVTMRVKQRDRCGGAVNTSCCCCCSTREMSRRIMMTKYYDDRAFAIGDSGAERPFRTESRLHERFFLGMNSQCPPPDHPSPYPSIIENFADVIHPQMRKNSERDSR